MNIVKKIENLVLLGRCLLRMVLHGAANSVPSSITRIIIVPAGKLGDVVCTTPVFRAVRERFPGAEIIAAGPKALLSSLLADSGLADSYLELSRRSRVETIQAARADIALVTGPTFEVTALLYLAGIPLVIAPRVVGGHSPLETRAYNMLKRCICTAPYAMGEYAPRERLRVLEPLGIVAEDTRKQLGFSSVAQTKIEKMLSAAGIDATRDFVIGISPSAGHKIKEWPEERFAAVIDHLVTTHGAKPILIGGAQDGPRVREVCAHLTHKNVVLDTQGQLTLDELKALISRLGLFISVDTGPIYIAEAFSVPAVDIVGPMDEREQPPRGPLYRTVVPPSRTRAQLSILSARNYDHEEALAQTMSITADAVIEAVDDLIRHLRMRAKR